MLPLKPSADLIWCHLQTKLTVVHHACVVPQRSLWLRVDMRIPGTNNQLSMMSWIEINDGLPPDPSIHSPGTSKVLVRELGLNPSHAAIEGQLDTMHWSTSTAVGIAPHWQGALHSRGLSWRIEHNGIDADVIQRWCCENLFLELLWIENMWRKDLVVALVHIVISFMALHADSAKPLAGPCASDARNYNSQRISVVGGQCFPVHGPGQQHLTRRVKSGGEGHRGAVSGCMGIRTLELYVF
mmetsp:Transcript_14498/g.25497  ORF Transcript_14498/g.25497 Transcript_14498/m.25497 type:complete len:241 (+) Transcript_14498:108-830(+)